MVEIQRGGPTPPLFCVSRQDVNARLLSPPALARTSRLRTAGEQQDFNGESAGVVGGSPTILTAMRPCRRPGLPLLDSVGARNSFEIARRWRPRRGDSAACPGHVGYGEHTDIVGTSPTRSKAGRRAVTDALLNAVARTARLDSETHTRTYFPGPFSRRRRTGDGGGLQASNRRDRIATAWGAVAPPG